ncbi:MAG: ABC transporter substrate-binding protein [Deltaproteobacteria bacterium]|jgi:peptide/nickel transport system substrate-binding protein|nr:ABC transporter substrate-binding protein [Deltaproteobacteria bacterium]
MATSCVVRRANRPGAAAASSAPFGSVLATALVFLAASAAALGVGGVAQADVLRLIYPKAPTSLDPQLHPPDPAAWPVVMTAYRRLFDLKPGTAELDNANSVAYTYRVSDDGRVYTIVLREGLTFSDGRPVDTAAALFTFDRLMAGETGRLYFPRLKSLEVVGPHTFRLILDAPWPPFLASLTTPMASLISPGLAGKPPGHLDARTLGSGRFEVEAFKSDSLKLRIRPDSPSVPKLDRIEFLFEPDPARRLELMDQAQAHLVSGPPQGFAGTENRPLVLTPSCETRFLAFNLVRPYLKLRGVREALGLLADAALRAEAPFPVQGFFPTGWVPWAAPAVRPPEELEKRAAELLAQMGPSRAPLSLVYRYEDVEGRPDAEKLAAKLREHGLTVNLIALQGAYGRGILEKADWDLMLDWRRPALPSPEMWAGGFLDSRASIVGNPAGFSSGEADRLIAEFPSPDQQAERVRILRQLERLALEQTPYVMLRLRPAAFVVDRRLENLRPHPMWPDVWPLDSVNLDPFKAAPPPALPEPEKVMDFDEPVAEPWE